SGSRGPPGKDDRFPPPARGRGSPRGGGRGGGGGGGGGGGRGRSAAPAGGGETGAAVARAREAFPAWRAVAPADRARLLRRVATLVEEHGEELARLESRNVGKPNAGARAQGGIGAP